MLTDTHCHIHEAKYPYDAGDVLARAHEAGVGRLICVGTDNVTSEEAVNFAKNHENVWASLGAHPHDSTDGYANIAKLANEKHPEVVAIGEIGLDYFYTHSLREAQIVALEAQLQIATSHNLPVIFHVREAFEDFWPIFHNFPGIRGELHSFTDTVENLEKALGEGLYIGINGISTFTKDKLQQATFDQIPLDRILLETDSPFLTPVPHRGRVNEPAFVRNVAEYHASRRRVELEHFARVTSANASLLFSL
ncbi:MAG: TatD family hydrolase [Candidatus Saccharimonadales bacterium]